MSEGLEDYEAQIADLAAELAGVGFMSQGSVVLRHTYCANAGCRCHADPPVPHGPYWQWSRAKGGRTITRRITPEQAVLYKEWIANRRRALAIIAQIEELSERAGEMLLKDAQNRRSHNPAGVRT
jgi:hypothetical protein